MIADSHLLVTIYNNRGQSYILKLSTANNLLKLIISDKSTAEKWKCAYDSSYIENLTRKTGNFKQFTVFVSMLKAGLLKTNESVYVELLAQEELEGRRKKTQKLPSGYHRSNRKYLILVYQVEFDKIHYPLPLEYSGAPDPSVLQGTIRRYEHEIHGLKNEIGRLKTQNRVEVEGGGTLKELVCHLNKENQVLYAEVARLKKELSEKEGSITGRGDKERERGNFREKIRSLELENRRLIGLVERLQRNTRHRIRYDSVLGGSRSGSPASVRSSGSRRKTNPGGGGSSFGGSSGDTKNTHPAKSSTESFLHKPKPRYKHTDSDVSRRRKRSAQRNQRKSTSLH